jgi:hypothetical protein
VLANISRSPAARAIIYRKVMSLGIAPPGVRDLEGGRDNAAAAAQVSGTTNPQNNSPNVL